MTAALATAPAAESVTITPPCGTDAAPQQFSGSRRPAAQNLGSAPVRSAHPIAAPDAPPLRQADVPIQSVPVGSGRSALPYLDSVPVSEPPFDDELVPGDASGGGLLSRTGKAGTAPAAGHQRWSESADVAPSSIAVKTRCDPTSASAVTGAPSARLATTPALFAGTVPTGGTLTSPAHTSSGSASAATTIAPPIRTRRRTQPSPNGPDNSPSTTGRRTAIGASGVPSWSSESDVGVRRTSTLALPPAMRTGQVFARALVEILSGRRPLAQLRVHCAPDIYAGLLDRPMPAAVCLPHLLTVRVCEPADGVAEVSAAFRRAQRVRAIAFRIQGVDGRWRITALEVG